MSDRGGYQFCAERKKLLSQKTHLVRTFHLSQSVYTQYKDLKLSEHFSSDDDFLGHLLRAEAAPRWRGSRFVNLLSELDPPITPEHTSTALFLTPVRASGSVHGEEKARKQTEPRPKRNARTRTI